MAEVCQRGECGEADWQAAPGSCGAGSHYAGDAHIRRKAVRPKGLWGPVQSPLDHGLPPGRAPDGRRQPPTVREGDARFSPIPMPGKSRPGVRGFGCKRRRGPIEFTGGSGIRGLAEWESPRSSAPGRWVLAFDCPCVGLGKNPRGPSTYPASGTSAPQSSGSLKLARNDVRVNPSRDEPRSLAHWR